MGRGFDVFERSVGGSLSFLSKSEGLVLVFCGVFCGFFLDKRLPRFLYFLRDYEIKKSLKQKSKKV